MVSEDVKIGLIVGAVYSVVLIAFVWSIMWEKEQAILNCEPGPAYKTMSPYKFSKFANKHEVYNYTIVTSFESAIIVHYERVCE